MPSAGEAQAQIDAWRAEFPIAERLIYLNNCSLTPLPRRGAKALEEYARTWTELGGRAWYQHWVGLLDDLRADFASVLGADLEEVALEPAVSAALVTIASSFDYSKRNKVVVADIDFPTDGHTWLALEREGVEVEFVHSPDGATVPLELFERAVDDRTALVCTGHVYYTSGYIQDVTRLADICHRKGAALVVDAYQSIGAIPFDVHASGVDFLVGGTLKWLMAGRAWRSCTPGGTASRRPIRRRSGGGRCAIRSRSTCSTWISPRARGGSSTARPRSRPRTPRGQGSSCCARSGSGRSARATSCCHNVSSTAHWHKAGPSGACEMPSSGPPS